MKTIACTVIGFITLWLTSIGAQAEKVHIVAAENFYGGVAEQIAGNEATVTSILTNPNQDPHEFTTDAATAKAVADADVVIYSGIGYDTWMDKLLGTSGKPGRVVICMADLIGAKDGDNPHIWYSPKTMPALAEKLSAVLSTRDPRNSDAYHQHTKDFLGSMKPLLDKISALKSAYHGYPVTATEPVFGYMSDALGLKMLNYDFQVNVMNDTEPSAAQTAAFEKSLTSPSVRALFYNSQVTDPTTERIKKIAEEAHVPIVGVTETQPAQSSYVEWMLSQLAGVEKALATELL